MAQERNIAEMKKLFHQLASQQDDPTSVSRFEFVKGLQATERFQCCSVEELSQIFTDVAEDGVVGEQDYMITEEEFIKALTLKNPKSVQDADLRACFKEFDSDGSGSINAAELRPKLESMGWQFDDEQFERLVKQADTSGDGSINYEEFSKAFRTDN